MELGYEIVPIPGTGMSYNRRIYQLLTYPPVHGVLHARWLSGGHDGRCRGATRPER